MYGILEGGRGGDGSHLHRSSTQQTRRDDRLAYIRVCAEHLEAAPAVETNKHTDFMRLGSSSMSVTEDDPHTVDRFSVVRHLHRAAETASADKGTGCAAILEQNRQDIA